MNYMGTDHHKQYSQMTVEEPGKSKLLRKVRRIRRVAKIRPPLSES